MDCDVGEATEGFYPNKIKNKYGKQVIVEKVNGVI